MVEILDLITAYLRQMWRFRWQAVITMWAVGLLGALLVLSLPNVYEAKSRFFVDANSRLRDVVQELGMTPNVSSRVFLVRQAMLSRPQLERVARETDLDLHVTTPEEGEQLIRQMMEDLSLSTGRGDEAQNLFSITYQHTDRTKSIAVVNALLNGFIEHVIEAKSTDTQRAESFLGDQLEYYRNLLSGVESQLESFKRQHPGFVVGEQGNTFDRLQEQRELLASLEQSLGVERDKRDELRRQLGRVNPYAPGEDSDKQASLLIPGSKTSALIQDLESQRQTLLLRVTERHPDVVAIDQQLERLRAQLEQELAQDAENRGPDGASTSTNPLYIQIQLKLSEANLRLAEVESQVRDARGLVAEFEERLNTAPQIERTFTELTRDYDKYRGLYDEVLLQSERERIGRVGDQQDVVTFNIIDPPTADLMPVSPPRLILLIAVFVLSILIGAGVSLLLAILNPTFATEAAIKTLPVPVIGTISMSDTPERTRRRVIDLGTLLGAAAVFGLIYLVIMVGMEQGSAVLQSILNRPV